MPLVRLSLRRRRGRRYDHVLFRFREHVDSVVYARGVLHRFAYTPFVMNMGEEPYEPAAIARRSANMTYFVHSKAVHYSRTQLELFDVYLRARDRYPWPTEKIKQYLEVRTREKSTRQIGEKLCSKLVRVFGRSMVLAREDEEAVWSRRLRRRAHHLQTVRRREPPQQRAVAPRRRRLMAVEGIDDVPLLDRQMLPAACRSSGAHFKGARSWEDDVPLELTYLWTVDFRAAPVACTLPILVEQGAAVHFEVDHEHCVYTGTCKRRLKVLGWDDGRGVGLEPHPASLTQRFVEHYARDAEFARVDGVICAYPAANCELFMPLNKSLVVYVTTRLELGRFDGSLWWRSKHADGAAAPRRWRDWVKLVIELARHPQHTVAANSRYDVEYIKYHTGVDALYLPSWCGDSDGSYGDPRNENWLGSSIVPMYMPTRDEVVIAPTEPMYSNQSSLGRTRKHVRGKEPHDPFTHPVYLDLRRALEQHAGRADKRPIVRFISELYDTPFDSSNLMHHPALVILPHDVSMISLFEYYRMAIPLFVPSLALLKQWCHEHDLLWERHVGRPARQVDLIAPHRRLDVPDPNAATDGAWAHWAPLSDFYTLPHMHYFDSFDDLIEQLSHDDIDSILQRTSAAMRAHNQQQRAELSAQWGAILAKIRQARVPKSDPLETHGRPL